RMQALQGQLLQAYDGIANQPIPQRTLALLQAPQANVVPIGHKRALNRPRTRVMNWGFALAASLVVAVSATLVTRLDQQSAQPGAAGMDSLLSVALETSPSRGDGWEALADGRKLRPVLSFQTTAGSWCREYLLRSSEGSWHGVACRGDTGWTTTVLAGADAAESSADYRPAGAASAEEVADFIDRNAAGIALDAAEETDLIARAWQ
ncbi:MAG: hypothetical protein ACRCVD_03690, partial [Halioglobus sp.]